MIDPARVHSNKTQFWKFASDILKASMQIYDKRVDNIVLRTNKVHGGIVRFNTDNGSI